MPSPVGRERVVACGWAGCFVSQEGKKALLSVAGHGCGSTLLGLHSPGVFGDPRVTPPSARLHTFRGYLRWDRARRRAAQVRSRRRAVSRPHRHGRADPRLAHAARPRDFVRRELGWLSALLPLSPEGPADPRRTLAEGTLSPIGSRAESRTMSPRTLYPVLVLRSLWSFAKLDIAFRRSSFGEILDRLLRGYTSSAKRLSRSESAAVIRRTLSAVRAATRCYYRTRPDCLPKSMTLYALLRSQDVPVEFVIGVAKYPFSAHAWVEHHGEPLDESPSNLRRYRVLLRA